MSDLDAFMKEIRKYPVLPKSEQLALAVAYHKGDQNAKDKLVKCNLRFVVHRAHVNLRRYSKPGVILQDLVQQGCHGLMMAIDKFDPARGFNLISYAVWWIDAYMKDFIRDNFYIMKYGTTQSGRILFFKYAEMSNIMEMKTTEEKIAARKVLAEKLYQITPADIEKHELRLASHEYSLDCPRNSINDKPLRDFIPADTVDMVDAIAKSKLAEMISKMMYEADLTAKETEVIKERYLNIDPPTLAVVGQKIGVTRQRAQQIQESAIKKLKEAFAINEITEEMV